MKAEGKLMYGVAAGETIHYDYAVVLPVIRHTVNALAATMEAMGETDSPPAAMYYRAAVMAEVMVSLGTLSKEEITADVLLDGMTDEDFDLVDAELAGIKKKADQLEAGLAGLRRATLALGQYGITPDAVEQMSLSQLTGYLDALGSLHGKKPARSTHTKSMRRSKKGKR